MNKYEIIKNIEQFCSPETAQAWDCVGFMVETPKQDISKVMLCLTPTADVIRQAKEQNCDMIVSHHPLFFVPCEWKDIDIYSAHTNMDLAIGGTTDTLIEASIQNLDNAVGVTKIPRNTDDFVGYIEFETPVSLKNVVADLRKISPNLRYVNNFDVQSVKKIGFCAGSASEFINDAAQEGADCFVTGDLKFHTALDSQIVVFDIGHFESEILILPIFEKFIGSDVEIVYAQEKSPFRS